MPTGTTVPSTVKADLGLTKLAMLLTLSTAIAAILLSLIMLLALGLVAVFSIERVRRWRADKKGFADFLAAGAPLRHTDLMNAFDVPSAFADHARRAAVVPMGCLAVPSGRIIVEDPSLAGHEGEIPAEFDTLFPSGRFPAEALVLSTPQDQRLAAVRVRFADATPVSLEPAFTEEWRVVQARLRRELPWFPIDSATAAIGTPASFGWLLERTAADENASGELVPGPEDGSNLYLTGQPSHLFRESGPADANLFIVSSGWGDGVASCYIQRDASQHPIALFVDFGMVGQPEWDR